jgi:hypothetical protein
MPEIIKNQDAQYALDLVKTICAEVGPGLPGTPQERARAEIIKKELEAHLGAENVVVEEFTLAPEAFLGAQLISTVCMLIAALLNTFTGTFTRISPLVTATAAIAFSISSVLLFILEFVIGYELVDPIFKKKQSENVIGSLRKPGDQPAKKLLILSGHHDNAFEFTWLRFTGYGFFFLNVTWLIALISVLVISTFRFVSVLAGNSDLVWIGTPGWVLWVYPILPAIIYALFFTRGRKNGGSVPGAADNLSGCALVAAMCRFLKNNPSYIPENTEIRFITFGSEEAGVRGSRRYVRRHLDELKRLDVRLLNYETIAHSEVTILTSETNGSVKNSPEMVGSVVTAAQRAGVPYKVKPATLGTSNDAGPFSRSGLKATSLVGFTMQQMVGFYHQVHDTPDVLSLEPLLNVLKLTFQWVSSGGEQVKKTADRDDAA